MARFGSIGTQYFDNSGDPLISGKIAFKESGTDTDKNTYADVNLTIANANPVILTAAGRQPNIYFDGNAKAILYSSADVQIEVRDPIPGNDRAGDAFADWNALVVYDEADIVKASDNLYYTSIASGNVGNNPTSTSGKWEEVRFIGVWDAAQTYSIGNIIVASDTNLYISLVNSNVNQNPTSTSGKWQLLSINIAALATNITFAKANPSILGADPDGITTLSSNTAVLGSLIKLYGNTHASQAGDLEVLDDETVVVRFDASASQLDLSAGDAYAISGTTVLNATTLGSGVLASSLTSLGTIASLDAGAIEFNTLSGTGAVTITDVLDEDNMASDSATKLSTQQSIKAYVDSSVGAADSWAESLAVAVTSGANSPSVASGQALLTNTISETTAASGVTIDSVLLKDNTVLAGTLLLGAGSVTDSSGAITFGNENLTTTGIVTAAGTSVFTNLDISGDVDVDGTTNLDVVDIDGAVNIATTALVTGVLTTTATQVATGGITSGSDIISDTDSTDSLGSTGVRWLKGWFDTLTAGTLTIGSGSIDDTSGSLALGSTNLTGVGTIGSGVITSTGDVIAGSDLISGDTIAWTGDTNTYFDHPSADTIRVITGGAVSATFNSSQGTVVAGILSTTSAGTSNFRAGVNAGNSIQSGGNYNVAVGDEAGTAITTGDNNVMIGYSAGLLVNTATDCTIVGSLAGDAATTASGITLVGNKAGGGLTTGGDNTAIGKQALKVATEGSGNTAVGKDALEATTTASDNTAVGKFALTLNTEGERNTAIGVNSGKAVTTGVNNSFVGSEVGYNLTTGDANIYIGYNNTASAVGVDNEILIATNGNGGGTNTIKFQTTGGSATLGLDGSDTSWAAASDSRLKKDVADSTVGLDFIKDLRPVTFKWNSKNAIADSLPQYDADSSDPIFGEGKSHHGFIAQEVKAVIDSHSDVLDGNNIWHTDPDGTQQLAQGNLVPMLVKAIQEQNTLIEALTARVITLEG